MILFAAPAVLVLSVLPKNLIDAMDYKDKKWPLSIQRPFRCFTRMRLCVSFVREALKLTDRRTIRMHTLHIRTIRVRTLRFGFSSTGSGSLQRLPARIGS